MTEELTENMTDETLKAIFKALPEDMSEGELCALTLSIYSTYIEKPERIMTELLGVIYTFGISSGLSREAISMGLRGAADIYSQEPPSRTTH